MTDEATSDPSWEDFHALEERLERVAARREVWTVFMFAFAAIAVIFSIIGIGFGSRAIDESKRNTRADALQPAGSAGAAAAAASAACPVSAHLPAGASDHGAAPAAGPTINVEAGDFFFNPTCLTAVPSGTVTLRVHNAGQALHNVSVPDQNVDTDVPAGQTVTVQVRVGSSPYRFFCKYHRTSGMVGAVVPAGS